MNSFRTARKPLEVRFDAPDVSSDGGLLLVKKVDERLGLTAGMAACLDDRRKDPIHSARKMLAQRVYGIAMGWEDANDFDKDDLGGDPLYELVLGSTPASQPTLSRFENSVGRKALYGLSRALAQAFLVRHKKKPPQRIVIDMDATVDPAHGQQEFEYYHGFYKSHCYLPLLVFCAADGGPQELVGAILRPGNSHAGRRAAAVLRRAVGLLREAFPRAELVFRGDAGFALPEVYETLEGLGVRYLVSLPKNARLLEKAAPLMDEAVRHRDDSGHKSRVFGETTYAAASWTKERRVIVKAEAMDKGENPRFVVTDIKGDPEDLYDEYCLRGDSENRIKEMKLEMSSGRTSCHRFLANAFRLLLHAAAYVLLQALRAMLEGTGLARATVGHVRLKLLKVAAQVAISTRRILVRLPRGHPHKRLFISLMG